MAWSTWQGIMNVESFSVEKSVAHSTMCIEPAPERFEASQSRFWDVCVCLHTHSCMYMHFVCVCIYFLCVYTHVMANEQLFCYCSSGDVHFFSCFDFQEEFLIGLEFSRKVRRAG